MTIWLRTNRHTSRVPKNRLYPYLVAMRYFLALKFEGKKTVMESMNLIRPERCFHLLLAAVFVAATLGANIDQWLPQSAEARLAIAAIHLEPASLLALPAWSIFLLAGLIIPAVTSTFIGLVRFTGWSRPAALGITVLVLLIHAMNSCHFRTRWRSCRPCTHLLGCCYCNDFLCASGCAFWCQ